MPDPFQLDGWETEEHSITKWPPTMAFDIANYLTNIDNVPLKTRLMSDYKDGKAYSYFASGWMGQVEYHVVDEGSDVCFLKSKCRQRVDLRLKSRLKLFLLWMPI